MDDNNSLAPEKASAEQVPAATTASTNIATSTGIPHASGDVEAEDDESPKPALDKGKGKARAVESNENDDEDDEDDEESEDDEDEDDDLDDDLDALIDEVDVNEIMPVTRQRSARSKPIDYSSAEAMQKAGVVPNEATADEEDDDGNFQGDETMEDV